MSSSLGYAIRRPEFEERRQWVAKALESTAPNLSKQERAWMTDVVFILNSFATVRAFKDYLGLDSAEAAERVAWAIRAIARGADAGRKNDDREKPS
jgi:hypothetical protein